MIILTGREFARIAELMNGPRWREWMARKLGKSIRTIKRYEDGTTKIPRSTIERLITVLREHNAKIDAEIRNLSG